MNIYNGTSSRFSNLNLNEEEEEEEIFICNDDGKGSENMSKFDILIGKFEDIIMDPEFVTLTNDFCRMYCQEFEEGEENKLSYTSIHAAYCDTVETYVERRLLDSIPGLTVNELHTILFENADSLEGGDIFDILNRYLIG